MNTDKLLVGVNVHLSKKGMNKPSTQPFIHSQYYVETIPCSLLHS